jgi:hydroxylysine kinase
MFKKLIRLNFLLGVDRIWNLSAVPKLKEFVFAVEDEERRALAVQVIENFQSSVVPHYGKLACGPIHGDLNEQNILGKTIL